jgi:hypothetical protein
MQEQRTVRPDPDPTSATTAALQREISALKDGTNTQMNGLEKVLTSRIEGIEKSIEVAHADAVRIPTMLQDGIANLKALIWGRLDTVKAECDGTNSANVEKFNGIQTQFAERDTRVELAAKEAKEALGAALTGQKEAVTEQNKANNLSIAKSEAATLKQIDGLISSIATLNTTLSEKIDDVKQRLTVIEGRATGQLESRVEVRENSNDVQNRWGLIVAIVVGAASIAYYAGHMTH